MGLVDKLMELDKSIWKQHEKVTQYCNKEFGWNKYDLARKAQTGATGSMVGAGTYNSLLALYTHSVSEIIGGAVLISLGYLLHRNVTEVLNHNEKVETEMLQRRGLVKKPEIKASRAATFVGVSIFTGALFSFFYSASAEGDGEKVRRLLELGSIGYFFFSFFCSSRNYFADQIMAPPTKKKTIPQAIKEKITGVEVPRLEQAQYHSIDNIVEVA